MLKRLRAGHPLLYCILAEVLFLGLMLVGSVLAVVLMLVLGLDTLLADDYLVSALQELVGVLVASVFLLRTGKWGLMRRRGCGFFNGLLVGMYPLFLIGYSAFFTLAVGRPDQPLKPAWQICTFFVGMILVGVAEEMLFRGVIAQTLLEHYGTSRKGIWKACAVSGALFGAAHLSNLLSSEPFGVLMQCVFAAALGILFAAIYFRTANLWVVVFLHAAMDVTSMLIGGLYGTISISESVSSYDATMLLSIVVYLLPAVFLLRRRKVGEVALYWGEAAKK